jgi:hypothetical protein
LEFSFNFDQHLCFISVVCPDGYFDVNCSRKCYLGLYGRIYHYSCPSKCRDTCHHVTGHCPRVSISTSSPELSNNPNMTRKQNTKQTNTESGTTSLFFSSQQTVNIRKSKYRNWIQIHLLWLVEGRLCLFCWSSSPSML